MKETSSLKSYKHMGHIRGTGQSQLLGSWHLSLNCMHPGTHACQSCTRNTGISQTRSFHEEHSQWGERTTSRLDRSTTLTYFIAQN